MKLRDVLEVLEYSKDDFTVDSFERILKEDEGLLEFADKYEYELNDFLELVTPTIIEHLKAKISKEVED